MNKNTKDIVTTQINSRKILVELHNWFLSQPVVNWHVTHSGKLLSAELESTLNSELKIEFRSMQVERTISEEDISTVCLSERPNHSKVDLTDSSENPACITKVDWHKLAPIQQTY